MENSSDFRPFIHKPNAVSVEANCEHHNTEIGLHVFQAVCDKQKAVKQVGEQVSETYFLIQTWACWWQEQGSRGQGSSDPPQC